MSTSRGLFLDLDGTLADSLDVMRRVYDRFLVHFGCMASDDEFNSLNGPPLKEVVRRLKATHGLPGDVDALVANYQTFIAEAYDDVEPSLGVRDVMNIAKEGQWVIGVVTSNDERLTRRWLERTGLDGLVDVMVCGGDVKVGKPSPEPYLLALERAGCAAEYSVGVEDSAQGSQSAQSAGLKTFGYEVHGPVDWPSGVTPVQSFDAIAAYLKGGAHA